MAYPTKQSYCRPHALPNNFRTSNTSLAAAHIFKYRVPQSTIELQLTTTDSINGRIFGNVLIRFHKYINDEIVRHGDGPLGAKHNPFILAPFSPPGTVLAGIKTNNVPVKLPAKCVPGEHMH